MYRSREGLGVWEHRGKVAVAGIGHSPTARRWDEKAETSVGAWQILAVQRCLEDAGITIDDVDGVVASPVGMGEPWSPRPIPEDFAKAYKPTPGKPDDGLYGVSADWLVTNMGLKNVKFTSHGPGCISTALAVAAQAVGDGLTNTCLVIRGTGNIAGRYGQYGAAAAETASGNQRWTNPWGWQLIPQIAYGFNQYCAKYGSNHDKMAAFVVNQHRNGLMFPEGFYYQNRPESLTVEDYLSARWVCKPLGLYDADMPIQTAWAYLYTTAERARDMKRKPIYILNHVTQRGVVRSSVETLAETEEFSDSIARKVYEGSGLSAGDVDIMNPYDGFTLFTQYFLEGFGWHGVKKGEAHDFYNGDIRVEGPHPFSSSGGNAGNGRTRTWIYTDSIQQLRGTAGQRQVTIKNGKPETAVAGAFTPGHSDWTVFSTSPD
ncbi:MAG: thiolase family protein [Chloroflexi bacterium]|nr:thiolase family protein [Chloroflexota bacterium]